MGAQIDEMGASHGLRHEGLGKSAKLPDSLSESGRESSRIPAVRLALPPSEDSVPADTPRLRKKRLEAQQQRALWTEVRALQGFPRHEGLQALLEASVFT
jgi:hypothetical protein